ncbi:MAG: DUF6089 family protein [Bacteroidales bacterium]|jgi:hypothetical protein|nr:DUF6089 family protein [Bacteroidales bacterium]
MKRFLLILLVLFISDITKAQYSEIGLCGGVSFYMGDLNPKGVFSGSRPAGGVLFRHNINPRLAFKATVMFGSLQASDAITGGDKARNLSFRSPLSEISAQLELNFLRLYNEKGQNPFSPYLFLGVSVFSFNPQAELNGVWYDLQPLGTEGQDLNIRDASGRMYDQKRYGLTGFSIPMGLGMRVNFLKYYCIGLEWGFRATFTDYLDDVSGSYVDRDLLIEYRSRLIADLADRTTTMITVEGEQFPDYHKAGTSRGNNAKTKDWYSFAALSFTFKLNYTKDCATKMGTSVGAKKRKSSNAALR